MLVRYPAQLAFQMSFNLKERQAGKATHKAQQIPIHRQKPDNTHTQPYAHTPTHRYERAHKLSHTYKISKIGNTRKYARKKDNFAHNRLH